MTNNLNCFVRDWLNVHCFGAFTIILREAKNKIFNYCYEIYYMKYDSCKWDQPEAILNVMIHHLNASILIKLRKLCSRNHTKDIY